MFGRVVALWRGEMPLAQAFWDWAVIAGLVVNVVTTFGSLALAMHDQRALALLVGYGIPVPYNVLVLVGVWRAAELQEKDLRRRFRLQVITTIWMIVLSII